MLKTKDVTLNSGAVVTVTEITVLQVVTLLQQDTAQGLSLNGYNLLYIATGLTAKDLLALTKTDLLNLWAACEEVHAFFFKLAQALKLPTLLPPLITAGLSTKSTNRFLSLLVPAATVSPKFTPGVTGILSRLAGGARKQRLNATKKLFWPCFMAAAAIRTV